MCPCNFEVLEATHKARLRVLVGCRVSLTPFKDPRQKSEIIGRNERVQQPIFFYRKRTAKIELVSRPGPAVEDSPEEAPTIKFPK